MNSSMQVDSLAKSAEPYCGANRAFEVIDLSSAWVQENPDLAGVNKPLKATQLRQQIKTRSLETEFKLLELITTTNKHVDKLYKDPKQFGLNRYEAILPYQYNLVDIKNSPQDNDDYINANYIEGVIPGTSYIATQAPLSNTVSHFWKMVDINEVSYVFMLCNIEEKNKVQSFRYWPMEEDPDCSVEAGGYRIILKSKKDLCPKLVERTLVLQCSATLKEKTIVQYQLKGWNDNEAPLKESVDALTRLLNKALNLTLLKKKMLFHCSAGIGRTGTFIALLNMKARVEMFVSQAAETEQKSLENFEFSIFSVVRRLREQRWGMVYRREQYIFIYEYMAKELEALGKQLQQEEQLES